MIPLMVQIKDGKYTIYRYNPYYIRYEVAMVFEDYVKFREYALGFIRDAAMDVKTLSDSVEVLAVALGYENEVSKEIPEVFKRAFPEGFDMP